MDLIHAGGSFGLVRVMVNRTKRTPKKSDQVIDALAQGRSVASACDIAGIGRTLYYQWRQDDPSFAERCDAAIESGTDRLEDIALYRATKPEDGSDTLLIFLLKARRPEKYRDNSKVEISGPDGGPMQFAGVVVPLPTRDDGE